ncbi:Crp/Fnr family transcriptional regulator [Actinomadura geliboluensis]
MTSTPLPLEPVVAWARRMSPGHTHIVTVDLQTPLSAAEWPYEIEEIIFTCALDGGPDFIVETTDDVAVILHRYGGTYGAARFLVTPRPAAGNKELWLTLSTYRGAIARVVPLPVIIDPTTTPDGTLVTLPGTRASHPEQGLADSQRVLDEDNPSTQTIHNSLEQVPQEHRPLSIPNPDDDHHGASANRPAPAIEPTLTPGTEDATTSHRPFWMRLTIEERVAFQEMAHLRTFPAKAPLLYQGDDSNHVVIIQKGWVKITSSAEDGNEVVLAVRGPGDLVGESATLGDRPRSATVIALGPLRALVASATAFRQFIDSYPRVWELITDTFTQRMDAADRRLQGHANSKIPQRLALLLAHLAEMSAAHEAPSTDGGIEIAPPLSQGELGSWVDASRETVARALNQLRRRGLIRTSWRRIVVTDLEGLRSYSTHEQHEERPG